MFLIIFFILAFYSDILEQLIPSFSYFDEIITLILLFISIIKYSLISKKINKIFTKSEVFVIILAFLLLFLASVSSYNSDVKNSLFLQIYTLLANIKFVILYLSCRLIFIDIKKKTLASFGKFALRQSYWFLYIMYILFVIDLIYNIFPTFGYRFGMYSIAYGFSHPAKFSTIVILQIAINLYFTAKLKGRISYTYLILSFFLLLTAGRTTAIAFFVLLFVLTISFRYFRKYVIAGVIIGIAGLLLVANQKLADTFLGNEHARGILLSTALQIAKDYFPFGSGLGTFGSHASRINYSPIYYIYGISNEWGLSPYHNTFITDSYWAMIIGELGFIGAILIISILFILLLNAYVSNKGIIGLFISIPMIYLITTSPIDTVMVSNSVVSIIMVTVILITIEKYSKLYS